MKFANYIEQLELGTNVTSLTGQFYATGGLQSITVNHTTPIAIADNAFDTSTDNTGGNQYGTAILWVPAGTRSAYKAADGWKNFTDIRPTHFLISMTATKRGKLTMNETEEVVSDTKDGEETVNNILLPYADNAVFATLPSRGYELVTLAQDGEAVLKEGDAGFNKSEASSYTVSSPVTPDNDGIAMKADYKATVYTLTYDLAGGTAPEPNNPDSYTVEDEITLKNPTRTGYDFAGWTGTELEGAQTTVTIADAIGDRAYTATWTPIIYDITYENLDFTPKAGVNAEDNPATYTIESAAITLQPATRRGYTFGGWYDNDALTGDAVTTIATGSWGDKTLYAKWTAIDYTVNYNVNGGELPSGAANPDTYTVESADKTLPLPTRTGYTFGGWYDNEELTGDAVTTIANNSVDNREYWAKWDIITYAITYTLDGGVATNPETYTIETETFTLVNPTKTGHTFKGWLENGEGDAQMEVTIAAGSTGDKAFTATWQINQYTLTFDSNGGSAVDAITQDYATSVEAPADPTREGYTFTGWLPAVPATIPAEDLTLVAQWHINQYTITFDTKGGSAISPITQDYATAVEAPADPTREGYTFDGWDKTIPATMPAEDMTITAQWTPVTYAISYDLDGGTVATDNPTSYTIESADITLTNPTKEHFDFAGWTGTDLASAASSVTIAQGSTGDRSYTATWTKAVYAVSVSGNGASLVSLSNAAPQYEDDVVVTIATDEDYELVSFTVDGTEHKDDLDAEGQYTIASVAANVSIVVTINATKEFITLAHAQQTFSCPQALDFTGSGLKAYIASGFDGGTVLLTRVEKVPAGTGLLIVGTEGQMYKIPYASVKAVYSNLLKPVLTAQTIAETTCDFTNYLYGEVDGVKGFYKSSGSGEVAAQKAYLQLPTSAVSGARIGMAFDDDATGIDSVSENVSDNAVYNLNGLKVADEFNPKRLPKGVYIVGGQKVVVKK